VEGELAERKKLECYRSGRRYVRLGTVKKEEQVETMQQMEKEK
jgi:hypothetical protein